MGFVGVFWIGALKVRGKDFEEVLQGDLKQGSFMSSTGGLSEGFCTGSSLNPTPQNG